MFKFPNISALLGSIVILLMFLAINISYTSAARTDGNWQERLGSYLETSWPEGRNILINGANKYLNFGIFSGSAGYGIRDNAGTIECKDQGGSWTPCQDGTGGGGGSSKWTDGGTVIYPTSGESIEVSSIAATGTATSTFVNLGVSGAFDFFGTIGTALSDFCVAITGGSGLCDGSDDGSGGGSNWDLVSGGVETATSTDFARAAYFVASSTSATSTFTNTKLTHIQANSSAGINIDSFNNTDIANFGVGSSANSLFYGGVNIDGATRLATSLSGILQATAGAVTATTTGTLTETVTGLQFDNTRALIGGSAILSLTSGYTIPLTASTSEWANKISSQWTTNGNDIYYTTGNVGIGVSSPSAKLSVTGSGTGTGLLALFADSANTPRMTMLDNGNVGIGTTGPTHKLEVLGTDNYPVQITGSAGGGFILGSYDSTAGGFWSSNATPTANNYTFLSRPTATYLNAPTADSTIYLIVNNAATTPGALLLNRYGVSINNGTIGATSGNGLVIGSGNVGIGDTSPAALFTVGSGDLFQINSSGAIAALTGISGATGVYDFGGATSLEIPNGASPTVDATGEVAVDTTSDQYIYYGASSKRVLTPFDEKSAFIASTTIDKDGVSFSVGTSTFEMANYSRAVTLDTFYCKTNTGTTTVRFGDGTNWTAVVVCGPGGGTGSSLSNNTFTAREDIQLQVGSAVGTPAKVTVSASFLTTAD